MLNFRDGCLWVQHHPVIVNTNKDSRTHTITDISHHGHLSDGHLPSRTHTIPDTYHPGHLPPRTFTTTDIYHHGHYFAKKKNWEIWIQNWSRIDIIGNTTKIWSLPFLVFFFKLMHYNGSILTWFPIGRFPVWLDFSGKLSLSKFSERVGAKGGQNSPKRDVLFSEKGLKYHMHAPEIIVAIPIWRNLY